jgi:hypothetical protein
MPSTFDMRFEPIRPSLETQLDKPPTLSLSPPSAGWIRWRIGQGDDAPLICMSDCYSPLVPLWVWSAAIAHGLMPVTLRINEEGYYTDLCAQAEGDGDLRLTVLQVDANGDEWRCALWQEAGCDWLSRLGRTLGGYLSDEFDVREWTLGPGLWPEAAQELPWGWPVEVARTIAQYACNWPAPCQRVRFFLVVAGRLDPFVLRKAWCPNNQEAFARLRFLLARQRLEALEGALAMVGTSHRCPSVGVLDQRFEDARDLFDELELQRETGSTDCPDLADARTLERALHRVAFGFESALHSLMQEAMDALLPYLPLAPGAWLVDEQGRPGRVLLIDGPRTVIDWGNIGIATECWAPVGSGTTWRWPVAPPDDFVFPDDPLFRRWRIFATTSMTAGYLVCPCCGYPHLEEDADEIVDCPLCGWPLFLVLHHALPDPNQPLFCDTTGDPETWPSLGESRRCFTEHGDAFPLAEHSRTQWLRRSDVAALRRSVIASFDAWLADPSSTIKSLPEDDWKRLAWMPKGPVGGAE